MRNSNQRKTPRFQGAESAAGLSLETLESRLVLSGPGASFDRFFQVGVAVESPTRTLSITGTVFDDDVRVEYQPGLQYDGQFIVKQQGREIARIDEFNRWFSFSGRLLRADLAVNNIRFDGKQGNDQMVNATKSPMTAWGGPGDDILVGGGAMDTLYGQAGNDRLEGGEDSDFLDGGDGMDRLFGNAGGDQVFGGAGNDLIEGGTGNDYLDGGWGNDTLLGMDGVDSLYGRSDQDNLKGGDGDDFLDGGDGDDQLFGENGYDRLLGGIGNDDLFGGAHNDWLDGGLGIDYLNGGGDSDFLHAGESDSNPQELPAGFKVVTTLPDRLPNQLVTLFEDKEEIKKSLDSMLYYGSQNLQVKLLQALKSFRFEGQNLYDIDPIEFLDPRQLVVSMRNGKPVISLVLPNNRIAFTSTQPTLLGSYADPRFSIRFRLEITMTLAPSGGFRLDSSSASVTILNIRGENFVGSLVNFVVRFVSLANRRSLEGIMNSMIQEKTAPEWRAIDSKIRSDLDNLNANLLRKAGGGDFTLAFSPQDKQFYLRLPAGVGL